MNWGSGLVVRFPGSDVAEGRLLALSLATPVSRRRYEAATFEVWGEVTC